MYNCWFLESMEAKVTGQMSVAWLDNSLLVMKSTRADQKPADIFVIGYSDPQGRYEALYHDERGVARVFNTTFDGKQLKLWREDTDMHQRLTLNITDEGLHSMAEASTDGGKTWRQDLEMNFVRVLK